MRASWRGLGIIVTARLMGCLPLTGARTLGTFAGRLAWWLRTKSVATTCANIERCFPDLTIAERQALARRSVIETCRTAAELGFAWHAGAAASLKAIEREEGLRHLDAAVASPGGTVILAPHFGNWEFLAFALGRRLTATFLYERPRDPLLEKALVRARSRWGLAMVSADVAGLRRLKRTLAAGGVVGLLPDQTPRPDAAVEAPFFGVEVATMTLAQRLVGPQTLVLMATVRRSAKGFSLCYERVDAAVGSADPKASAAAMNRAIEAAVRRDPAQYQWEYKRFRRRRRRSAAPVRGRQQHEQGEDFQAPEQHGQGQQPLGGGVEPGVVQGHVAKPGA